MLSFLLRPGQIRRPYYDLYLKRQRQERGYEDIEVPEQETSLTIKFFDLWFPVFLWLGMIFYFSSIPGLKSGLSYDYVLRKSAHVIEYFVLTLLLYRAFKGSCRKVFYYSFLLSMTAAFFYAVSDEFHQRFVFGRSGCFRDICVDAIGILGFFTVGLIFKISRRKKNRLDSVGARNVYPKDRRSLIKEAHPWAQKVEKY